MSGDRLLRLAREAGYLAEADETPLPFEGWCVAHDKPLGEHTPRSLRRREARRGDA
jgi:hypothetical protein